jgi:hypothetical protein
LKYSIDSSSLIHAWKNLYPPDVFAGVWSRLSSAIDDEGIIKITEAVYIELEQQRDPLFDWVNQRDTSFIVPFDRDIQESVTDIQADYPSLVDIENNRSVADPFVIALAQMNGCAVVTQETFVGEGAKRLKIPNVCQGMGIVYLDFLGMIRAESWTF